MSKQFTLLRNVPWFEPQPGHGELIPEAGVLSHCLPQSVLVLLPFMEVRGETVTAPACPVPEPAHAGSLLQAGKWGASHGWGQSLAGTAFPVPPA